MNNKRLNLLTIEKNDKIDDPNVIIDDEFNIIFLSYPVIELFMYYLGKVIIDDELAVSGYYLNSIEDFLLLDIQKYLLSSHIVKECDYCKRLYIPKRKSDKYCRLPNFEKLTCNELAHRNRNKTDLNV